MAYPFGGHPTLRMFVEEAVGLGCTEELVTRTSKSGQVYRALQIRASGGAALVIVNPNMAGMLAPTVVGNYQRRLGITTTFSALPPSAEAPSE